MSALTTQLQQLKEQQEELEKRIQEEEERKKKLNNEASIERLEALVEPITECLNNCRSGHPQQLSYREQSQQVYDQQLRQYNYNLVDVRYKNRLNDLHRPRKRDELEKEEIYVTLIGIIKKQDQRIKKLEELVSQHWFHIHENIDGRYTLSK
tara:strand:+ start:5009 stop:5464 length:456 start_codon:yes stop_codon:yes gene_type:complete